MLYFIFGLSVGIFLTFFVIKRELKKRNIKINCKGASHAGDDTE